jgi:hypothetical protein
MHSPSSSPPPSPDTERQGENPPTTLQMARKFHRLAADAEWDGNTTLAQHYRKISITYHLRHDDGDLYDPPF